MISTTAILETTDEWSIRILEDLDGIEATAAAGRAEIISLEGDENWVPEMEDMLEFRCSTASMFLAPSSNKHCFVDWCNFR